FPAFLPDGRHFLFSISSAARETRGIYVGSLDGGSKQRLFEGGSAARYVSGERGGVGWVVFGRDGALLAQPFDARRLELSGEPVSLSATVGTDLITMSSNVTFSLSETGVLVFDPGITRARRQYQWVDRSGRNIRSLDVPAGIFQIFLSPDEKRFIGDRIDLQNGTYDLWIYDESGGNATRFTFDPHHDFCPVWSPDGTKIVWAKSEDGTSNLYEKAANLAGDEAPLLKSDVVKFPTDWSRDGRYIIYFVLDPTNKADLWALELNQNGEPRSFPLVRTEGNDGSGAVSPNGKWLAYASDMSGRSEVYVQRFPDGGGKRQISTSGGENPRWRSDGRELFYYSGDGKIVSAAVTNVESLDMSAAVPLFQFRAGTAPGFGSYAVTSDGKRFLIDTVVENEANSPLTVVVNWMAEAKK